MAAFLGVRPASFVWFKIIKNTKILTKNQPTNWRIQSGSGEILVILGVFDDFKPDKTGRTNAKKAATGCKTFYFHAHTSRIQPGKKSADHQTNLVRSEP